MCVNTHVLLKLFVVDAFGGGSGAAFHHTYNMCNTFEIAQTVFSYSYIAAYITFY